MAVDVGDHAAATRRAEPSLRLLAGMVRWRYPLLCVLGGLVFVTGVVKLRAISDWAFFSWGGGLLFGEHRSFDRAGEHFAGTLPGGMHVYANYSMLQIGPPALLMARAIELLPGSGAVLAAAVIQGLGLLAIYSADRAFRGRDEFAFKALVLTGGAIVTVAWASLAQAHHLDDALALTAMCAAMWCLREQKPLLAGVLLGVGAASKPWAVAVIPLVLVAPSVGARCKAGLAAVVAVLVCWLPFVVADHRTLYLGQVQLVLRPDAALAALPTAWLPQSEHLRLAQLVGGLVLAVIVTVRGHAELAALIAFAWRLGLDTDTYRYYGPALILAALIADLGRLGQQRLPVLTGITVAGWVIAGAVSPGVASVLRLVEYGGLVVFSLAAASARSPTDHPAQPPVATQAI